MPFPSILEEFLAAGYEFIRPERYPDPDTCPVCGDAVENFTTPGKREISMNPMCNLLAPAVRHFLTCNTRTNPVDAPPVVSAPKPSPEPNQSQASAGIDGIPMFGVSDKNHQLLSVGWREGILVCQWGKGRGYHTGIPEDLYIKLRRVPFAYRQYNSTIKGKYPYIKLS